MPSHPSLFPKEAWFILTKQWGKRSEGDNVGVHVDPPLAQQERHPHNIRVVRSRGIFGYPDAIWQRRWDPLYRHLGTVPPLPLGLNCAVQINVVGP